MAKRTKEDALETRERILDAAVEVFDRRGVSRPSLTEIAELAGVTRGAVYGHFQNKADLFSALADRIQLPDESLCQGSHQSCDPLGELRNRCLFMYREVMSNEQWQRIFAIILLRCEWVPENGEIHQRCSEGHAEGTERLRTLIQGAVTVGQLPADLDVEVAVPVVHAGIIGLLQEWLMRPEAFNIAEVGARHVEAMLEMLKNSAHLRKIPTAETSELAATTTGAE
ncbi:TetR family transcriptional regulator [Microbulbifer elongatus]|uniref:TetR family transcriptional regulator n=1 Tax=Microbulbifer elongatus TaxID=86173 RepID=A0ABT1P297_9GAMM|nr:TetR family transcriptional regulator [Microbulbifer elongatus]MCQ3830242.1 TetR family transcriptional regulator [Microbulbifer elongatus]